MICVNDQVVRSRWLDIGQDHFFFFFFFFCFLFKEFRIYYLKDSLHLARSRSQPFNDNINFSRKWRGSFVHVEIE